MYNAISLLPSDYDEDHNPQANSGIRIPYCRNEGICMLLIPADMSFDVYTLLNPRSLVLKQFDPLTNGTSSGSANTMSTHY